MTWVCEEARTGLPGATMHRDAWLQQPNPHYWICGYETGDDAEALAHADSPGHILLDYPHADRNKRPTRRCMPSDWFGSYIEDAR